MTNSNHQDLWGDLFEIAVKRGAISYLLHCQLLSNTDSIKFWTTYTVRDLRQHLEMQLAATDQNYLQLAHSYLDHLLVVGYGLGWTCLRQVLNRFHSVHKPRLHLKTLWCPLNLRDRRPDYAERETDAQATLTDFWQTFQLDGQPDPFWLKTGAPARADFFLLLEIEQSTLQNFLLCLEFSLNAPFQLADFNNSEAHLQELESYVRRIEKRGVFTRLNTEVTSDTMAFSSDLASYMSAFSGPDKPLFKLCQASSYLTQLAHQLRRINPQRPLEVQALAVTTAGIEGLAARFDTTADPRTQLLETLGRVYRQRNKIKFDDPKALYDELRGALRKIQTALPAELRRALKDFIDNPPVGKELQCTINETIDEFHNPDIHVTLIEALNWIDAEDGVELLFNAPPKLAIERTLNALGIAEQPCLRDLHAAAVQTGLNAAKYGQINVLALEGYPGIGKTTAVKDWLHKQNDGFLFLYFSPRVVINSKVMQELGATSTVLTLTSDSNFIINAQQHHYATVKNHQYVTGAVAFAGIEETQMIRPEKGILFLNVAQVQTIEEFHVKHGLKNYPVSMDRSKLASDINIGVWRTLALAARQVLDINSNLNCLAITAAIQGYRKLNASTTTVDGLSNLFKYKHDKPQARVERQTWSQRIPTIVVMIDEITGDSAGVLAARKLGLWLEQEFIHPFSIQGQTSPFRVIFIIADASLSNAHVLQRHVESGNASPDKILISKSYGIKPLRLATSFLRLNSHKKLPTLHIEAFGFPAAFPLTLHYELRLLPLARPITKLHELQLTPRRIINDATRVNIQNQVQQLIIKILEETKITKEQIIFFAQDRELLEVIASELKHWAEMTDVPELKGLENAIITLHSGVPQNRRDDLIQPAMRDSMRVILMTSSGSRGVSFPCATRIIALVPRFAIETSLMELAQLIYRGRGYYTDSNQPGISISGDHKVRTLTFLINDFIINDSDTEPQEQLNQWVRQSLDFLTFVVLLRATVWTRICGDAGMPRQKLAVVPVGRISSDELSNLLSGNVRGLVRELNTLLANTKLKNRGRFSSALERIEKLFVNSIYQQRKPSIATNGVAKDLSFGLTYNIQPLVQHPVQWVIPDNVYCVGPLWLERMDDVVADEQYEFALLDAEQRAEFDMLQKQLYALNCDSALPKDLRRQALILYTMMYKPAIDAEIAIKYTAMKTTQLRQYWNCFPVDYSRFILPTQTASINVETQSIAIDDAGWYSALNRAIMAVCSVSDIFPALPVYKKIPFLVILTSNDPTDLERSMDDRYFCASSEVNLLNALLFAASENAE